MFVSTGPKAAANYIFAEFTCDGSARNRTVVAQKGQVALRTSSAASSEGNEKNRRQSVQLTTKYPSALRGIQSGNVRETSSHNGKQLEATTIVRLGYFGQSL